MSSSHSAQVSQHAGSLTLGSGGLSLNKDTATQLTSTTTAVEVTSKCGVITCFTSTLAALTSASFTVNAPVSADSAVLVSMSGYSGTTGLPSVAVTSVASGSFTVRVHNSHATEALDGIVKLAYVSF